MITELSDMTSFSWATVTSTAPLRIKLDGDSAALLLTPETLVDPVLLAINDRVRVELSQRKVVIHGHATTGKLDGRFYTKTQLNAGQLDTRYYTETEINNMLGSRGCVPSSVVVGAGSASADSAGLVTFTNVTWLSLNDVFSGGGVYELFLRWNNITGTQGMGWRLRSGGSDATTNYDNQRGSDAAAASTAQQTLAADSGVIAVTSLGGTNWQGTARVLLFWPDLADETLSMGHGLVTPNPMTSGTGVGHWRVGTQHRTATAYSGLSLIASAGTFTGTTKIVRVA